MKTYYVKDKIVFSSDTSSYEIPPSIDDIKIPRDTKNYITSNKIIITDIDKLKEKKGKELNLSKPIDDFDALKQKLINSKKKKKPSPDDYDFLEKTSALQIVDGIISSFSDERAEFLKDNIDNYIKRIKDDERRTNVDLSEQIEIEGSKLKKVNDDKKKFFKENIEQVEKQIEKSLTNIKKFEEEKSKLDLKIEDSGKKKVTPNSVKVNEKISLIEHGIKNNELEIKILKARISSLKSEMRLGKSKCVNWVLFVVTLGLIYWTKYSDCKYHLLRLEQKINKLNEKNLIAEKKKYNLQKLLDDESSKDSKNSVEKAKENENMIAKIEELEISIQKEESSVNKLKTDLKKKEKEIAKYDKDVEKIASKLRELESINEEFIKYSSKKIEEKFEEFISENKKKMKTIEDLKSKIESQKTQIEGDWVIEV